MCKSDFHPTFTPSVFLLTPLFPPEETKKKSEIAIRKGTKAQKSIVRGIAPLGSVLQLKCGSGDLLTF